MEPVTTDKEPVSRFGQSNGRVPICERTDRVRSVAALEVVFRHFVDTMRR